MLKKGLSVTKYLTGLKENATCLNFFAAMLTLVLDKFFYISSNQSTLLSFDNKISTFVIGKDRSVLHSSHNGIVQSHVRTTTFILAFRFTKPSQTKRSKHDTFTCIRQHVYV